MISLAAASEPCGRRYHCLLTVASLFFPDGTHYAERTDLCHFDSLSPVKTLSALSLTPVNSLSPVSTTPMIRFFPDVIDTGQK